MSAKIISERHRVVDKWYEMCYYKKNESRDAWYGFDCDEKGTVLLDKLHPCAIENYVALKNNPDWESSIRTCTNSYIQNAVAECPYCHRHFELWNAYEGACECECGQWFNMFGQELNPPEMWDEYDCGEEW